MQILKFGDNSLADSAAVQFVAQLVREHARKEKTEYPGTRIGPAVRSITR